MAKIVKYYLGYRIKENGTRDSSTYKFQIIKPSWSTLEPIWECDSMDECIGFIEDDKKEDESQKICKGHQENNDCDTCQYFITCIGGIEKL